MNLRERLLFLLIPLTILPPIFITVVAIFLVHQIASPALTQPYAVLALVFIGVVSVAVIAILISTANSISYPLKTLTDSTRKIAAGDWEASVPVEAGTKEIDQLSGAIDQMKTDLKRQQEVLRQEAAHAAIGRIATHVAHDLASPLSSMKTVLEYFKEPVGDASKTSNYINLLELSSKRLQAISKELLDWHKGNGPKKVFYALHKVLDELIGEYQSQDSYGCVEFIKQYHREQIYLYGERDRIHRVFGNLIKNAIEAMDKCGTLTVTTQTLDSNAVIEVQDTGSGMEPALLAKVLQGGVSQGKADGHGIGTQVIRRTIEEYRGTLSAASTVSVGTTFRVELPLPESNQVREAEREEGIVEEFEITAKKGEPIIVIDDDAGFLEQWRLMLEKEKHSALLCVSYEDFMAQELGTKFGKTAVVDYHFENSELNGLEVIAKLKELGFESLYLCTVEYWKPHLKKQAADLGVKICPKPLPKIAVCHSEPRAKNPDGIGIASAPVEPRNDKREYKVLVIDDDLVIRMGWELAVKKLGIGSLFAFENLEQLLGHDLDLSAIDLAFVDKNIKGSQFGGADCIVHLRKWGAKKIILASGEDEETLRQDPAFEQADFIISEKIPDSFKAFFS